MLDFDDEDGLTDDSYADDNPSLAPSSTTDQDALQRLRQAQASVLANRNYLPRGGVTHCNEATYDVAKQMGIDVSPFEGQPGTAALANDQARGLAAAAAQAGSGWRKISKDDAQALANQGKVVVMGWQDPSGGHGHTVTVMADPKGDPGNPTMAQIGGGKYGNGSMRLSKAISSHKWGDLGVSVYEKP